MSSMKVKIQNYWVNEGPKSLFMFLFLGINCGLFVQSFLQYKNSKFFPVLSYGVCLAKASAACLKFSSAILLLPVCRNFLSWLRGTWVNNFIPIDKNLVFHKFCAWWIAIHTAIHCVAHFWNFYTLSTTPLEDLEKIGFAAVPSTISLSFYSLPGTTGHFALLIMVLMYTSAVESVRRPLFEGFWFTHHLFILYYALISVHGVAALFGPPQFVYWIAGPLVFYGIERTIRLMRGKQDTMLVLARQHPSRVIELRMKKHAFPYKPGQYLFLNCPYIAQHEWHPFTITSAPEDDWVSVHINIVGNWTGGLAALLNPEKKLGIVQQDLLKSPDGSSILRIDGPFGAASEDVFKFKTVMLVGAGIGVTPFSSILKHIRNVLRENPNQPPINKVYFYWICRDKNAFEWFARELAELEKDNVNDFLQINIYLTGGLGLEEVRDVMYNMGEQEADHITGLAAPTHFGRPKWTDIFLEICYKHPNSDVGVFFCGPRVLSKELYKNSRKHTSILEGGCRFHYNKENF
eukprot:Phypoly_transcript_03888.p1 GENE.Phypoly_transcript_03888~~Phypoly_transcript_03888.p1  ORF type:complete len:518 (+),score=83.63 Phypoly_transcript_03888:117-1670(+)